jgi:hypothetical protein
VKQISAILAALLAGAIALLYLPGTMRLELYDVGDLTYNLQDFPSVDISLATDPPLDPILDVELLQTGMELAEKLQPLAPTADLGMIFQNGLLIVRATAIQHVAVRGALFGYRVRNSSVTWTINRLTRAKAALSAALLGMITK